MGHDRTAEVTLEGQQQVLRATFPGIRVRELLGVRTDALARKFHETHDMAVKNDLEHLLKEYGKLEEPWSFRVKLSKAETKRAAYTEERFFPR